MAFRPEDCEQPCPCQKILNPVCGSDGQTYPNGCLAECAGVMEYVAGECGAEPVCTKDKHCPESTDPCERPTCDTLTGQCLVLSTTCAMRVDPCPGSGGQTPGAPNRPMRRIPDPLVCCQYLPCGVTDTCFDVNPGTNANRSCKDRGKALGKECKYKNGECREEIRACKKLKKQKDFAECESRDDCELVRRGLASLVEKGRGGALAISVVFGSGMEFFFPP